MIHSILLDSIIVSYWIHTLILIIDDVHIDVYESLYTKLLNGCIRTRFMQLNDTIFSYLFLSVVQLLSVSK